MSLVWDYEQVCRTLMLFGGDCLSPHQVLLVDLVCRRKYNGTCNMHLGRAIITCMADADQIRRWHRDAFPDGLVVFVCPSPVNLLAALAKTQWQYAGDKPGPRSAYKQLMTNLTHERAGGFMDIDLDTKDEIRLNAAKDVLRSAGVVSLILAVIETVGGYHIIYYNAKKSIKHKLLHDFQQSTSFTKPNILGEPTPARWFTITRKPHGVPMPGTLQNGFPVKLVDTAAFVPDAFLSQKVTCTK